LSAADQTVSGVPGRYAAALFELAGESKAVDKTWASLSKFQGLLDSSPELARLVRSPVFKADDQIASLETICAKAGISGLALNFIKLIAANRRLTGVGQMISGFQQLMAQANGEVQAEVTSAEKLSPAQITKIKAALKSTVGRDAQLTTRVDPSILGGLIVKVGSKMMDNSLKTKLQNLKVAMKGTA
jgi:F-type H+-transporting ATPase subunit delta